MYSNGKRIDKYSINVWPGYVDILSIILLVILFVFVIAFARYQYLGYLIGKGEKEIQAIIKLFEDEDFKLIDGKIVIQHSVLFDTDSYVLKEAGKSRLRNIGIKLKKYLQGETKKKFSILVEGHTDTRADNDHNMNLSLKRAKAVTDFWQIELDFGTEKDMEIDLIPAGYGETRLLEYTPDNIANTANRRIEIRIIPKFDAMLEGWYSDQKNGR